MSTALRITFLVHAVVALVMGLPLLIIPGQFLGELLRWVPFDPLISRLFGAALLALAWGSYRGWQATERAQVKTVLEIEAVFTVLGSIGLLRHLLIASYPAIVWAVFILLVVFAIAWIYFLIKK
jgi:hypothetical protein